MQAAVSVTVVSPSINFEFSLKRVFEVMMTCQNQHEKSSLDLKMEHRSLNQTAEIHVKS